MKMTIIAFHPEALCLAKLLSFGSEEKNNGQGKKTEQ